MDNLKLNHLDFRNVNYSVIDFIQDLKKELQKYPELLSKRFPERIKKFKERDLSKIWRSNLYFVKNLKRRLKTKNDSISIIRLYELENNITKKFKEKGCKCLEIINQYKILKTSPFNFLQLICEELGRISIDIKVTDLELSELFGFEKTYIASHVRPIVNRYKFTLIALTNLEKNLRLILGDNIGFFLFYIKKYNKHNPNLKNYTNQQYTIGNPNYFNELKSEEQYYWLGFLFADGFLDDKKNRIQFQLKAKDRDRIEQFALRVKFPKTRIKNVKRELMDKKGKFHTFNIVRIRFGCKIMSLNLKQLDFLRFKKSEIGLPNFIISTIKEANKESFDLSKSKIGRFSLAFLLGFYDGDGTYKGGNSARIYNSNKKILLDFKKWYKSTNNVILQRKGLNNNKDIWSININPELFVQMINSFPFSMMRKRPI